MTPDQQPDLFSPSPDDLRDAGIKRVLANHEDAQRRHAFEKAFTRCVQSGKPFMGEDVRLAMADRYAEPPPQWWGGAFRSCLLPALKAGEVKVAGIGKPSCRESHSSMKRVYVGVRPEAR